MKLAITCTIGICGHLLDGDGWKYMKYSRGIARMYGIIYIEVDDESASL
jgi:hypothetical protein